MLCEVSSFLLCTFVCPMILLKGKGYIYLMMATVKLLATLLTITATTTTITSHYTFIFFAEKKTTTFFIYDEVDSFYWEINLRLKFVMASSSCLLSTVSARVNSKGVFVFSEIGPFSCALVLHLLHLFKFPSIFWCDPSSKKVGYKIILYFPKGQKRLPVKKYIW